MTALPDGTVTFLFTDIEASTELTRRLGRDFAAVRAAVREIQRRAVDAHGGHEIDTEGDGFFAAFARASDAVAAAVAAQRDLAAAEWPEGAAVAVRMAIHTTEPFVQEGGYTGVGVSRAARICGAANGGQIVVSHATAGILEDVGREGVRLRDLGEHSLKDIAAPQRIFEVDADGMEATVRPLKVHGGARSVGTLVAIDLAGFRGVMQRLGDDRAAAVAAAYQRIVVDVAERHGGRVVERVADWTLSLFARPRDAVAAADEVRNALAEQRWEGIDGPPRVRVGVWTGRVADPDAQILGTVAIHTRRLCDFAAAGQVLVGETTHALLEGESLEPLALREAGMHEVDGEPARRVYEVIPA